MRYGVNGNEHFGSIDGWVISPILDIILYFQKNLLN